MNIEKNQFKPETPESKEEPTKEVWIIDDDEAIVASALRFWQMKLKDAGYTFRHFLTAKEALAEIEKLQTEKEDKKAPPMFIFVDGQLEKDEGEFKQGAYVVKQLREIKEIAQPKIIAHSSNFDYNFDMMLAGADLAIGKDANKTAEFLQDPEAYLKKQKPETKDNKNS